MTRPAILCISFSTIERDARVLRQIATLSEFGKVTTVGYGEKPEGSSRHIRVPDNKPSLPQTIGGVLRLAVRAHRSVEMRSPAERAVRDAVLQSGTYQLVVANDARALPLAFAASKSAPIWADMHEWAEEENATSLPWRVLVGPYMASLCRRYLGQTAAVSTVGRTLASLYELHYGVPEPVVIRNASPHLDLQPSPLESRRVRLVHSGIAVPERNIEALIDAVQLIDERFTLDLYLIGTPRYIERLRKRAGGCERIRFKDPVPTVELPGVLNRYDLGVYLLPIRSINHRFMLPNKFFEFVQARIGLVFGPSQETDRLIADHGLGVVLPGWEATDLATTLSTLEDSDILRFKAGAHRASRELSSIRDQTAIRNLVAGIVGSAR